MAKALDTLLNTLAEKLGMGDDGAGLLDALKKTAFKPYKDKGSGQFISPTDAQIMALLVVSNQYGLNPWTKEIYAYPDKSGGIVPLVGVDGWSRIINSHPMFDGVEFEQDADMCTCTLYRKDRNHPTRITEYMVECRGSMGPWLTHPYRLLRHRALIQCSRYAFGFVGIYEQDEAERIIDAVDMSTGEVIQVTKPRRASEVQAALNVPEAPVTLEPVIPQAQEVHAEVSQVTPQATAQVSQVTAQKAAPAVQTGEPASQGECMNVIKTATAKKINLGALLADLGLDLDPATLTGMTKDTFKSIKAVL